MEIFKGDESSKEDRGFLYNGKFGLNCGIARDKDVPWVCVRLHSQDVAGDAAGGDCVEGYDIFILESLILSLSVRRKPLSLLGLLSSVPFLNNLSTLIMQTILSNILENRGFSKLLYVFY